MIVLEYAEFQAKQFTVGVNDSLAASVVLRMQLACLFSRPIQTPPNLVIDIFWSTAALTYYVNILIKLKSRNGKIYSFSFVYRGLVYLLRGNISELGDSCGDYRYIYVSRRGWILKKKHWSQMFLYFAQMEAAYLAIKASVSADIPWLFFVFIYCLAQLKSVWLDKDSPFWDPRNQSVRLGVGQIMALILLTGLLLVGVDSFIGAKPTRVEAAPDDAGKKYDDTEAACIQRGLDADLDAILDELSFRRFLLIFSAWNMVVLFYAGINSGGPWDVNGLNISVVCLIASLLVWGKTLELYNLVAIVLRKF
jgi:hypothetical protein